MVGILCCFSFRLFEVMPNGMSQCIVATAEKSHKIKTEDNAMERLRWIWYVFSFQTFGVCRSERKFVESFQIIIYYTSTVCVSAFWLAVYFKRAIFVSKKEKIIWRLRLYLKKNIQEKTPSCYYHWRSRDKIEEIGTAKIF